MRTTEPALLPILEHAVDAGPSFAVCRLCWPSDSQLGVSMLGAALGVHLAKAGSLRIVGSALARRLRSARASAARLVV